MYKQLKYISLAVLLLPINFFVSAATPNDSIKVSLLTCEPGTEIYALFGHTAIRYENSPKGIDAVFNYGMFDFRAPNFIWRYIKGETDYQLGVVDYQYFAEEYTSRNSAVYQQTINLLPTEKEKLWDALSENYLPENRTYRYNFFYDNCATRPRDKIEESINGIIHYNKNNSRQSFRDIIHECTKGHEWAEFGIDLCLGSKADEPIDYRLKMFAPFYLMNAVSTAKIVTKENKERSLVSSTSQVITKSGNIEEQKTAKYPAPLQVSIFLLLVTLLVSFWGLKKKKVFWGYDIVLFITAGCAGCIIAFLACFSEHPAVSPNYLLFFLHPIHLLYVPFMVQNARKRKKDLYHLINFAILTLFIVLWGIIPQRFALAVLPLALSLWVRSASYIILTYKHR